MGLSVRKISFGTPLLESVGHSGTQASAAGTVTPKVNPQTQTQTVPSEGTAVNGSNKKREAIAFGLAVVATGLSTAALVKSGKNTALKNEITALRNETNRLNVTLNDLRASMTNEAGERIGIKAYVDKMLETMQKQIDEGKITAEEALKEARAKVAGLIGKADILTREVTVNGRKMNLVTNMHGYGVKEAELTEALQTEATKRMAGLVDRSHIVPGDTITVRVPTSELTGVAKTGGLAIVPREVIANLGALVNNKQKVRMIADMPMYLGEIERNLESGKQTFTELRKLANGKFRYLSNGSVVTGKDLEYLGSMKLPIYTSTAKTNEEVGMYIARDVEQAVDFKLMRKYIPQEDRKAIESALEKSGVYDNNLFHIAKDKDGKISAKIKFDTVFYKHDKFDMKGPSGVGGEINKNIYNNYTHNAGETERFMYFDKFFYEGLTQSKSVTSDPLGADMILGNDWHTGGISAMMKLLTHAKKAVGEITNETAEKLLNTPVFSILHNANESGINYHQTEQIFNVMFGEHAAKIVPNAYMPSAEKLGIPQEFALPQKCWNGLMHENCIDPQTMMVSYSDVVIPVSGNYGEEISSIGVLGRANFELFKIRNYITKHLGIGGSKTRTMVGITNGCDRVNNVLTEAKLDEIADALNIDRKKLRVYKEGENVLEWHNSNKEAILERVIPDVADKTHNPMKISDIEHTDLTGVTKNTPIYSIAGRMVKQKGVDISVEAVEEFLRMNKFPDGNYPVFYFQGIGDPIYRDMVLALKRKVAASPELGGQAAANRIVFANLFTEKGRYDACKIMSDFAKMPSWSEPCGLVHKEIAATSGAVPIVNEVGGLCAGLTHKVNAFFAKFRPANPHRSGVIKENAKSFADAMTEALNVYRDKDAFAKLIDASYKADHSWLVDGGAAEQYAKLMVEYNVLKPEALCRAAA